MGLYIVMAIYIACSAFGLVLIKVGVNKGAGLTASGGVLSVSLGLPALLGLLLYLTSFLLSMGILSKMELSFFYPMSAGLIYIAVCLLSFLILKESVTVTKLIGALAILAGVVIMNIKS